MAIAVGTPDYGDAKLLVGVAENVFVGRIARKLGSRPMRHGLRLPLCGEPKPHCVPGVQYAVEVEENVEGRLVGTIGLGQEGTGGGWIEDHAPLLEVGRSLPATRYDAGEGWHVVAAQPWDVVRVEDEHRREALSEGFERALRGGSLRPCYRDPRLPERSSRSSR